MALIGHKPRNATVTAQTPMRLLAFNISSFKKLLDEMPAAQKYIYELLETRARENSQK
jgi:CRP-like cAMP-binding protein